MGDISAEPSMEEILSSIKRIIAEESDPAGQTRARRGAPRPLGPASAPERGDADDVLELRQRLDAAMASPDPVEDVRDDDAEPEWAEQSEPAPTRAATPAPAPTPRARDEQRSREEQRASVSAATVEAARGALDSLTRLVVKPEPNGDGTLEGLVRDMLRPMISAWLDQHLPTLVEDMVAREIARITAAQER